MPKIPAKLKKLEDAPEALRGFYTKKDDAYILDAEGAVLEEDHDAEISTINGRLAEFRDNNIKYKKELDKFKDVDPAEYTRLKTENETLKKSTLQPSDVAQQIAKEVEKATAALTNSVETLRAEKDAANNRLAEKELHDKLWMVGQRAGVRDEARDFFLSVAAPQFKIEGDALVGVKRKMDGSEEPLFSKKKGRAGDPLTAEEWALEIAPLDPKLSILYKDSNGTGTPPHKTQSEGGKRIIPNEPGAISRSIEDLAKGNVLVQG